MSLSDVAARGAAATLVGQWIKFLIQGLALVVLARLLTPEDFGIYAMVVAIAGIALLLGDFGLSMASVQATSITAAQRTNLFWVNIAIGLTCGGLLLAMAVPISTFYGYPELVAVTQSLAVVFLLQAATAQFAANASRSYRFRLLAWNDITAQALALGVAVTTAALGFGYWALVLQQITVAAFTLGGLLVTTNWWPTLPRRKTPLRSLLLFGSNTFGVQAINYVSANADSVLLGRFWGSEVLGIYDRAYQVFRLPLQQIAAPMTRVALPILSRINEDDIFAKYIARAQLVLVYLVGGAFALSVAVSQPLLNLVLGPGWGNAASIFAILAAGGVFQCMGYVYYWIFLAKGRTGLQLQFAVFTRLLMLGFLIVGAFWGSTGVAIAASSGLLVNWIILTVFAVPRTGVAVRPLVEKSVPPLVLYGVMVALVYPASLYLTSDLNDWMAIALLTAACLVIMGCGYLLVPRIRRDCRLLLETIRKGRSVA